MGFIKGELDEEYNMYINGHMRIRDILSYIYTWAKEPIPDLKPCSRDGLRGTDLYT